MNGLERKRKQRAQKARRDLAQRVERLTRQYQEFLGLERWDIVIRFVELEGEIVGRNYSNPRYREATIEFDIEKMIQRTDRLNHDIVHELADVMMSPGRSLAQSLWERIRDDTFEGMSVSIERLPLDKKRA